MVSRLNYRVSKILVKKGECSKSQSRGSSEEGEVSKSHSIVQTIDVLQGSLGDLEDRMTHIETQCRQFDACTGKMDDDVCCNACTKVADSLSITTQNVNTLYNALLSDGLLTDKVSENLIMNFQDG